MKTTTNRVIITTDDGFETLTDAADVAEVAAGRLQVARVDGSREMIGGSIFGAYGRWKMWHQDSRRDVDKFLTEDPLTMPGDYTHFRYYRDGSSVWPKQDRAGRIKRLKRADL